MTPGEAREFDQIWGVERQGNTRKTAQEASAYWTELNIDQRRSVNNNATNTRLCGLASHILSDVDTGHVANPEFISIQEVEAQFNDLSVMRKHLRMVGEE